MTTDRSSLVFAVVFRCMRLLHHGMTIDLDDGDRRVAVIEALLFGGLLPQPIPVRRPEPEAPAPLEEAPPTIEVPAAIDAFWAELHDNERHELVLLASHRYRVDELEKALGLTSRGMAIQHSRLSRVARKNGLPHAVVSHGTKRTTRIYALAEQLTPFVKVLAERRN